MGKDKLQSNLHLVSYLGTELEIVSYSPSHKLSLPRSSLYQLE